MKKNADSAWRRQRRVVQYVLTVRPAKALPLFPVSRGEGVQDLAEPVRPRVVQTREAQPLTAAHAAKPMMSKMRTSTAIALTFTSYDSIFFPRYSGVRPTISPPGIR